MTEYERIGREWLTAGVEASRVVEQRHREVLAAMQEMHDGMVSAVATAGAKFVVAFTTATSDCRPEGAAMSTYEACYDEAGDLPKPPIRLSVNINEETRDAIYELSDRWGVSATEVIRRTVSIAKFVLDELVDGGKSLQVVGAEETKTILAAVDGAFRTPTATSHTEGAQK